jgi:hypothetical protein
MGIRDQIMLIDTDITNIFGRLVEHNRLAPHVALGHQRYNDDVRRNALAIIMARNPDDIKGPTFFFLTEQKVRINYMLNQNNGILHLLTQNEINQLNLAKESIDSERYHLGK